VGQRAFALQRRDLGVEQFGCDQASDGQILVDAKVCASVEHCFELQPVGELIPKGLHHPVKAFNVLAQKNG
jgi:class 3 adenylate cyclase